MLDLPAAHVQNDIFIVGIVPSHCLKTREQPVSNKIAIRPLLTTDVTQPPEIVAVVKPKSIGMTVKHTRSSIRWIGDLVDGDSVPIPTFQVLHFSLLCPELKAHVRIDDALKHRA